MKFNNKRETVCYIKGGRLKAFSVIHTTKSTQYSLGNVTYM